MCLQLCTGTIWDRTLQQLHVLHSQGTLLEETTEATDSAHSKQLAQVYQVRLLSLATRPWSALEQSYSTASKCMTADWIHHVQCSANQQDVSLAGKVALEPAAARAKLLHACLAGRQAGRKLLVHMARCTACLEHWCMEAG